MRVPGRRLLAICSTKHDLTGSMQVKVIFLSANSCSVSRQTFPLKSRCLAVRNVICFQLSEQDALQKQREISCKGFNRLQWF